MTALGVSAIADAVRAGALSASQLAADCLARIERCNPALNAFTHLTPERATEAARRADSRVARGEDPGPLAGVPYAVKALFDIAGRATDAGSSIHAAAPPAERDADIVRRMDAAGAVLVGVTTMDEYAYGFTTENAHVGAARNPRDPTRVAGGSSGGSAAAVAAGLVPLALGTDTNGSVRVPASFCGVYGLKPTFGRLSRSGAFGFVDSLDHTGLFATDPHGLARAYDAAQGRDAADPWQDPRAPALVGTPEDDIDGLRIGVLNAWFRADADDDALAALDRVATAVRATPVTLPHADAARAAAFCITAAEAGARHLGNLRARADAFDPATRDRLLAGAMMPAAIVERARRFRAWFRARVDDMLRHYDVLLALATPMAAPPLGADPSVRNRIGLYTQPISFIGLPVIAAPIRHTGGLPIGLQIIAAPWAEATAFRAAAALERAGLTGCDIAEGWAT